MPAGISTAFRANGREKLELAFLDATSSLFFLIARDGTYIDFHGAEGEATFAPPAEFLGRTITEILPEDVAERCSRAVAEALESGNPRNVEYELEVDGELRAYDAYIIPNDVDEVVAVVRDLTEQRKQDFALRESEAHLRSIFETVREPIAVSCRGTLMFINPAYAQLFGYENAADLRGRPVADLIAGDPDPAPASFIAQCRRRDGSRFEVEARVSTYAHAGEIYQTTTLRELARLLPATGPHTARPKLSQRELQVVRLVAEGKSTKEIAATLEISIKTADSHRTHSMAKLGVHDTVSLLRYCLREGLVTL